MDRRQFLRIGASSAAVAVLPLAGCALDSAPIVERVTGKVAVDVYGTRWEALPKQHRFAISTGALAKGPRDLNYPVGVAVTQGLAYVVESGNHRVQIFDERARSKGFLGAGELNYPGGIAARDGEIWVADSRNARLVQYVDGKRTATIDDVFSAPRGIAMLDDRLIVADPGLRQVVVVTRAGKVTGTIGRDWTLPWDVATDGQRVFVADAGRPEIAMFDDGKRTSIALEIAPTFVTYGIDGTLYVS